MFEPGDIKSFNPDKDRAREIILEVLIRHRDAFKQARTGELINSSVEELKDNNRKINQVRALNLIISAQREMINISRAQIHHNTLNKWKKKYKTEEERKEHPFEDEENDYKELLFWRDFLKSCLESIIMAEKTPSKEDDFMIEKIDSSGNNVIELTVNFYDMLDDLEDSHEAINTLMLVHKIISAGVEEDEEMTYKEKEKEAIRRVVEA